LGPSLWVNNWFPWKIFQEVLEGEHADHGCSFSPIQEHGSMQAQHVQSLYLSYSYPLKWYIIVNSQWDGEFYQNAMVEKMKEVYGYDCSVQQPKPSIMKKYE
jgi:hypothetical protein